MNLNPPSSAPMSGLVVTKAASYPKVTRRSSSQPMAKRITLHWSLKLPPTRLLPMPMTRTCHTMAIYPLSPRIPYIQALALLTIQTILSPTKQPTAQGSAGMRRGQLSPTLCYQTQTKVQAATISLSLDMPSRQGTRVGVDGMEVCVGGVVCDLTWQERSTGCGIVASSLPEEHTKLPNTLTNHVVT